MLFGKTWINHVLPNLRPDEVRIKQLNKLRAALKVAHLEFARAVYCAPSTTRKAYRQMLDNLRNQNPRKSEVDLFRMLIDSRLASISMKELGTRAMDKFVSNGNAIYNFGSMSRCIIAINESQPEYIDKLGIRKQVEDILSQEESEIRSVADKLISEIQNAYLRLSHDHPGKDGHWYLANVWLNRYGGTAQAAEKGPRKTNFIAYKETFAFSVLDWPTSMIALSLFFVYKELGEKYAWLNNSEFNQFMEESRRASEDGSFMDIYKKKNPKLWEDNQEEGDVFSLYWLYKGAESSFKHP